MNPSRGSQELWTGLTGSWLALSSIVAGITFWGGVGFVADRFVGTAPWLTVVGVLLGNAVGIYLIYLKESARDRSSGRAA